MDVDQGVEYEDKQEELFGRKRGGFFYKFWKCVR
jgi:hypothetical protein